MTDRTIAEIFSEFLQIPTSAKEECKWVIDPALHRGMRNLCSSEEHSQEEWALFFLEQLRDDPDQHKKELAFLHLSAYLQQECLYVASGIYRKLTKGGNSSGELADLFQIGISLLPNILRETNPYCGSRFKFYVRTSLKNRITGNLRERRIADICTDNALLRRTSQKCLRDSLVEFGYRNTVEDCIVVWRCFKEASDQDNDSSLLTPGLLDKVADLYTKQTNSLTRPNREWMRVLLGVCSTSVRSYLSPKITNRDISDFDSLLPVDLDSLVDKFVLAENQDIFDGQVEAVNRVLLRVLLGFSRADQEQLRMYYGEGLTQAEIAVALREKNPKMKCGQPAVSRRLNNLRSEFLCALAKWSQEKLNISLNPDILSNMSMFIDEWSQEHYKNKDANTNTENGTRQEFSCAAR